MLYLHSEMRLWCTSARWRDSLSCRYPTSVNTVQHFDMSITQASSRGTRHFYANECHGGPAAALWCMWVVRTHGERRWGRGKLWDTVKTLNFFKSVLHIKPQTIKWLLSLLLVWLWHFMDRTSVQLFISPKQSVNKWWNWSGHRVGNSMEAMCTDNCINDSKTQQLIEEFDLSKVTLS